MSITRQAIQNHKRLRLVHGLPSIPGYADSNDSIKATVELLTEGGLNLATSEGAFTPRIGSMSQGGNYISMGDAGDVLLETPYSRVTESITLTASPGNMLDRVRLEGELHYMKRKAEEFWDRKGNFDPVYLEWALEGVTGVGGAELVQYALVYTLDMAWSDGVPQTVTLSIVRRHDWWPFAPGQTPQYWTKYNAGVALTPANSYLDISPGANNHVVNGTVHFNTRWDSGSTSYNYRGYLDIPAASLPGDLPLLCTIAVRLNTYSPSGGFSPDFVLVSRYTKPTVWQTPSMDYAPLNTLEAALMTLGTNAAVVADTDAMNGNAVEVTFATATLARRLSMNIGRINGIRSTIVPGRYLVYARASPQAGVSTYRLQLRIRTDSSGEYTAIGDEVLVPAWDGVTLFQWGVINLGEFTIPQWATAPNGVGLTPNDVFIELYASRSGGTAALRIADLTFIPTDEGAVAMVGAGTLDQSLVTPVSYILDGSHYGSHGYPEDTAVRTLSGAVSEPLAIQGAMINLRPKVDNRLYFWAYNRGVYQTNYPNNNTTRSANVASMDVAVSVVPRWLGGRDR